MASTSSLRMFFLGLLVPVLCGASIAQSTGLHGPQGRVEAPTQAWVEQALEGIAHAEYRFTRLDEGLWSAPNRSQGLRSWVGAWGLELSPLEEEQGGTDAPWRLRLKTVRFGRVGSMQSLGVPILSASGNRISLKHGSVVEWFLNNAQGIEQGWDLAVRPEGTGDLILGLELGARMRFILSDDGQSGTFVDSNGEAHASYSKPQAWDASGRVLGVRIEEVPSGLQVRVDDAGAIYPLVVDPLITASNWSVESNKAGANLGFRVAGAGDVNGDGYSDVIVGASLHISFPGGER